MTTSIFTALVDAVVIDIQKAFKAIGREYRRVLLTWHIRVLDCEEKHIRAELVRKETDLLYSEYRANEELANNLRRRHSLVRRLADLDAEALL